MRILRRWLARVRTIFGARYAEADLRHEIDSHLEEAIDEHVARGLSREQARRAALVEFGGVTRAEEAWRDVRGRIWRDLAKDVRYGLRSLARHRAYTVVAVLSLAVGIGGNTAVFSIVNALALRPPPVANPDEIVQLYVGDTGHPYETTSYPSYLDLRDRHGVFTGLAAYGVRQFTLTEVDQAEPLWGEVVSANYFDVLGVGAHLGRVFAASDESAPTGATVVIGYGLWQRRFGADPNVIGRRVSINRQPVTVVAVAPREFMGMFRGLASQVWLPAGVMPIVEPDRALLSSRGSRWLTLVGRLQSGVTLEQARARFDLLSREMQTSHPEEWRSVRPETGRLRELFVSVLPERDTRIHPTMQTDAYAFVAVFVAIVNGVLVIACLNLAGMLLAQAITRRKEIAVRLALGASRMRLVRQLLTESLLLSTLAGATGLVVTAWAFAVLLASMPVLPEGFRLGLDLHLDWRVFAYTFGVSAITGMLFGLFPALQGTRPDVSAVLKDDSAAVTGGVRRSRARMALVVVQVACSLVLLICAGLVLRGLERMRPTRVGFSSDQIVVAPLTLSEAQYDRSRTQGFYQQLSDRVASLPGVQAVSLFGGMPGGFTGNSRRSTEIEGYAPAAGERLDIEFALAGPRYFTNMQVPIVQGRDFDERDRDGAPCVAIVNEAFLRRYFAPNTAALGRHLARFGAAGAKDLCAIVGVIRDDRWQSLQTAVQPFYAMPVYQSDYRRMSLFVHTASDPAAHVAAVRRLIRDTDPNIPVTEVRTLNEYFGATLYPFRLLGAGMAICGVMALLLAAIGMYGIVSYAAAQRTREVGIRIALGALKHDILRMVVGQGVTLVALGLALGLLASVAVMVGLSAALAESGLLFGVSATDTLTFAGVTLLLALVAAAACYVPARRAANVDPVDALR